MKLEKKRYDEVLILRFTGEFDSFNLPGFQERVESMIDAGDVFFILDTRLLKFINSAAFGFLLRLRKLLAEKGGGLVIARPSKFMRKTLVTFGVEDVFPIFESVEDAIVHFKKGADVDQLDLGDTEADESLHGEVAVLFRPAGKEGEGSPNQVGRIMNLYQDGLTFQFTPAGELDPVALNLDKGSKLKLKFRQPFVVKEHFFEMDGDVKQVAVLESEDGSRTGLEVRVQYDRILDEDRKFLDQFIRDQEEWRREIRREM